MNKMFTAIIMMCATAICCTGQTFLNKYPKLTKKNLSEFFFEWKAYSDSVASTVNCKSDVCNAINAEMDSIFRLIRFLEGNLSHDYFGKPYYRYGIIPQKIPVEYYSITPTPNDTLFFQYDYASLYEEIVVRDTITPKLRPNELYLTGGISDRLMEFITGGNVANKRPHKLMKKNIKELRRYIGWYNGEHNGGVIFNDYPYVWKVQATNDFIVLHIRDSNYSGYEQWYLKRDNQFEKLKGKRGTWIE